jgi:hypothetical protein
MTAVASILTMTIWQKTAIAWLLVNVISVAMLYVKKQ